MDLVSHIAKLVHELTRHERGDQDPGAVAVGDEHLCGLFEREPDDYREGVLSLVRATLAGDGPERAAQAGTAALGEDRAALAARVAQAAAVMHAEIMAQR